MAIESVKIDGRSALVARMPDSNLVKIVFDDGEIRFATPVGTTQESTLVKVRNLVEARHWFDPKADDDYVYHGAQTKHLDHIKAHGITAFLRTYFATDPKVSMHYGYRPNIHHPSDSKKLQGVLLRVHKQHVDPEEYKRHSRSREDFWTGGDISPEHIEIHKGGGKWKPLV